MKIFYSWQSDLPNRNNRGFIDNCINKIINKYKNSIAIEADRDVKNNTGSPDIANTIFKKIDDCDLFVADISIINKSKYKLFRGNNRPTPNPNVLLELGYAASVLGWNRIVCIYNTDYSDLDALPFDLRQHRITAYSLKGKPKNKVKEDIVESISATMDGLIASGTPTRPKGSQSFHKLLSFNTKNNKLENTLSISKIDFLSEKQNLIDMACKLVNKLNSSSIDFTGNKENSFEDTIIVLDLSSIKKINNDEKKDVTLTVKDILNMELKKNAFCFGYLTEQYNHLKGGYDQCGTDEEVQKYKDYLLLKRILTEIKIWELFSKSFEDIFILPLAIKNTSKNLDKNINIQVTIEGENFELISPTKELINNELMKNAGFICDFGFIANAFSMLETPEIKFDENIALWDYFNEDSNINFWDRETNYDIEDCVNVLCDYIATPSTSNIVEFKISSLQANETKWLNKIILIKINSGNIKLKYSIKSDNTDGSILNIIE